MTNDVIAVAPATSIVNEFKGYSTFIELEDPILRSYNQWTVLYNLKNNKLFQLMEDYLLNLPKEDRAAVGNMGWRIKREGLEEVKRQMTLAVA